MELMISFFYTDAVAMLYFYGDLTICGEEGAIFRVVYRDEFYYRIIREH